MATFQCPCCDYFSLTTRGEYEICHVCFWEDDGSDVDDPDRYSGPNRMALRTGRHNFRQFGASDRAVLPHVLPPFARANFAREERRLPRRGH